MSENEMVVIPEQAAIAVFRDQNGYVVLKQAGQHGPEEDERVFIAEVHALRVATAILKAAGLDLAIVPWTQVLVRNGRGEMLRPFPDRETLFAVDEAGRQADAAEAADRARRQSITRQ